MRAVNRMEVEECGYIGGLYKGMNRDPGGDKSSRREVTQST